MICWRYVPRDSDIGKWVEGVKALQLNTEPTITIGDTTYDISLDTDTCHEVATVHTADAEPASFILRKGWRCEEITYTDIERWRETAPHAMFVYRELRAEEAGR